jgi:hypothetical protein
MVPVRVGVAEFMAVSNRCNQQLRGADIFAPLSRTRHFTPSGKERD